MVEEHSPEFVDAGEKQKIDFFDGDVHLGHYDFRFDFNDKKHFSIARDGTGRIRVHSQKNISKLCILLEDEDFRFLFKMKVDFISKLEKGSSRTSIFGS